jgi:hypothetical protein
LGTAHRTAALPSDHCSTPRTERCSLTSALPQRDRHARLVRKLLREHCSLISAVLSREHCSRDRPPAPRWSVTPRRTGGRLLADLFASLRTEHNSRISATLRQDSAPPSAGALLSKEHLVRCSRKSTALGLVRDPLREQCSPIRALLSMRRAALGLEGLCSGEGCVWGWVV